MRLGLSFTLAILMLCLLWSVVLFVGSLHYYRCKFLIRQSSVLILVIPSQYSQHIIFVQYFSIPIHKSLQQIIVYLKLWTIGLDQSKCFSQIEIVPRQQILPLQLKSFLKGYFLFHDSDKRIFNFIGKFQFRSQVLLLL